MSAAAVQDFPRIMSGSESGSADSFIRDLENSHQRQATLHHIIAGLSRDWHLFTK